MTTTRADAGGSPEGRDPGDVLHAHRTEAAEERRRTASALALAPEADLAEAWRAWPEIAGADRPEVDFLREPESGIVMVQARTGGTGDRFHLGEATATRATALVRAGGAEATGTAYVLGSRPEHAALAAIFDALLASPQGDLVRGRVIEPLEAARVERERADRAAARSTVVDFFTVARENLGVDDEEDDE